MKINKYLIILLLLSVISVNADTPKQHLVHVVLLWLKEAGDLEYRQSFIDACRKFVDIPDVLDMHIG